MKKTRLPIIAAALLLSLTACSQSSTPETSAPETTTAPVTIPETSEETEDAKEETSKEAAPEAGAAVFDGDTNKLGPIMKEIYETGKFDVGYTAQKPPQQFHLTINGVDNVVGFEVEMTNLIAERLSEYFGRDVEQEINIFTVQGGLAALQAKQIDCMPTLSPTPERRENYDFSQSYHWSVQTIGYLKERQQDEMFDPAREMEGVTVAVVKGTTNESGLAQKYPKCTILSLEKQSDVLIAVLTKKADAFLMNEKTAILYVAANPELMYDLDLSYNVDLTMDPGAAYCVPKGNEDFVAIIDEVVTRIREDGTFEKIEADAIALCDNAEVLEAYMADKVQ